MRFKCRECDDIEYFDDAEEARDNDWHRLGSSWLCPDCSDEEESSGDDEDDDERSGFGNFSNRSNGFSFGGGNFGGGGAKA